MYLGSSTQARLEEAIRDIASGLSPQVGDQFFQSLVHLLGDATGVDHVFVADLDAVDHDRANLIALCSRGRIVSPGCLRLGGSAAQVVLDQGGLSVAARVRDEFPDDEFLAGTGAESFVGRRLLDSAGLSIGLLGVIHGAPQPDPSYTESLLGTFSARTAAELERRRLENVLRSNEHRLRSIIERAPVSIHELDSSGRFLSINAEGARLAGRQYAEEIVGRYYLEHVAPWDKKRVSDLLAEATQGRVCKFEYTSVVEGVARVLSASFVPVSDEDGGVAKILCYSHDITAQKESEEELVRRAEHDSLTDLPNRGLFMDRLRSGIARAKRSNQPLALLFVDLNDFKPVNDTHGHHTGDRLLRVVAQRLMGTVREVDTVARVGGDEFAVILEAINDTEDAAAVAAKIAESIGQPFSIDRQTLRIGASTGIAMYPTDGEEVSALLQHADAEMYRAKRAGGRYSA